MLITAFMCRATCLSLHSCVAPHAYHCIHMSRHTYFTSFMCRATRLSLHSCVAPLPFGRIHASHHKHFDAIMRRATHVSPHSYVAPNAYRPIHVSRHSRLAAFMCCATHTFRRIMCHPMTAYRLGNIQYAISELIMTHSKPKYFIAETNNKYDQI